MSNWATVLLALGVVSQFIGIVALGWPDFIPWKEHLSRWLTYACQRAENRLRRLFRRPPRTHTSSLSASFSARASVSGAVTVAVSDGASLEDKVAFLLRQDQKAQQLKNKVAARLNALEQEGPKRLDEVRAERKGHFEERVIVVLNRYRPLRQAGAVLLAVGLICLSVANFV